MRVLFTTWAWPSHLYALTPLALACRAAGHEVVFASQPGLTADILRANLPAAVVGKDVDTVGMVREYLLPRQAGGNRPRALRMLLAHAESTVDDLTRLVRDWRADLVIYDQTALAGPLAAAAAGVPAVRHLYGTDLLLRARAMLPEALAPLAGRLGAGSFDPFGKATVDPVPQSLQLPGDYRRLPMRYLPYNGPETTAWSPPEARGRPRVCVSWGHTIAKVEESRFLAGRIAAAVSELDVQVVLAVSAAQGARLGPVPDGVRVVLDVPLWHVMRGCDVFIGHGGAGGILTALSHGVPMLLAPQLPDHAGHAAQVEARGAGTVLGLDELTAPVIRERVAKLLADSDESRAAGELQEEMRRQPAPADVVGALTES